jgi:hypothetical protein
MIQSTLFASLYILILFLIGLVIYKFTGNPKPVDNSNVRMDDIKIGMTFVEFQSTLNWMFQMGLIDAFEYNKLLTSATPFLKGGN